MNDEVEAEVTEMDETEASGDVTGIDEYADDELDEFMDQPRAWENEDDM